MSSVLKLENVSKAFMDGDVQIEVLKSISLKVNRGEFIAIEGPSGSGKSTLLSIIGALLTPTSGSIFIDNENISKYQPAELTKVRLNNIGFIFQSSNLIPFLSVKDQLLLVSDINKSRNNEYKTKAAQLIHDLGLAHREDSKIHQLSGGEKQRVAIARAFMNNPDLILADEPTASLDSDRGRQVVEMLSREVKNMNKAAIMVTHDKRMLDLCDRVLHIEDGKLTERQKK
ncbi:ABC transporter ATP-binding protein [Sutcliffiella halmapala]|uniref:ABC transporter ATP-binding protein n=1 Tax=Sutcliffiella halmapala TaxID=79882 RepID=UPI00099593EB|nr:ABC transporter ATP-binding protein [Sutcliffiella halmapala]